MLISLMFLQETILTKAKSIEGKCKINYYHIDRYTQCLFLIYSELNSISMLLNLRIRDRKPRQI